MIRTGVRFFVAATALLLTILPLDANTLLPGDTGTPDVFADPGNVTPLGYMNGTFSFGSGIGLITGTYFEVVVVDPLGITCSGCLDFAFQLTLDPGLSAGIFNARFGRFGGYTTDIGYLDGSGIAPISVSRGTGGAGIGFVFASTASQTNVIAPGDSSAILVVATDATAYDNLGVIGISGGRGTSPANGQLTGLFEPEPQAPEPSAVLLFGVGLAGIAIIRRRIG